MSQPGPLVAATPTADSARLTGLDLIRGVAVLGILVMNAVSFGLADGAYLNISFDGMATPLDWAVGVFGEIFVDQKFMGLFSALFGAGIVLFADRAADKGKHPALLSLWRNLLLFFVGFVHALLWSGDILMVYALACPVLLVLRKLKPVTLFVSGTLVVLLSPLTAILVQGTVSADGSELGPLWGTGEMGELVGLFFLVDIFSRAIGMMLIGVGLYRTGVIAGRRSPGFYRKMALWGMGVGIPLSALGMFWVAANDFAPSVALIGTVPNTLGTIPMTLGYIGLIALWNMRPDTSLVVRLRAVGRMALTNYLTQSLIGVGVLTALFAGVDLTRTMIAVFVVSVWALQIWWSKPWLDRFRFGPAEWAWRSATYFRWQPLRR